MKTNRYKCSDNQDVLFRTGIDILATDKTSLGIAADGGRGKSGHMLW